ncbi:MAG: multiheme c-type cytochrome [Desulforegulaceae bacterium]|nr:multiheme c-type cytochrome [Desulforegulaceae bacterium]
MKLKSISAFIILIFIFGIAYAGIANYSKPKVMTVERAMPEEAKACIECHGELNPGLVADWAMSRHAHAGITCYDCHRAEPGDPDINSAHKKEYNNKDLPYGDSKYYVPISTIVSPKDCSRCHAQEAEEYAKSKHANTLEIIWKIDFWLIDGMNSELERESGCYYCHGSVVEMEKDGSFKEGSWPNVGVGRLNPDGSLGSCTSCHTRHRFSVGEARKPEACGQCHLGPDHPQIEIYNESKHGDLYHTFKDEYNFDAAPGTWTPGVDYRGPTCASCHMSGVKGVNTSHDVTERLSWELQAPMSIRPENFEAFPADTNWEEERSKMALVCQQCHSKSWTDDHYRKTDNVIKEYNEVYYKPAKEMLDKLYAEGKLDKSKFFDEVLEVEFYELWHHEGRRARMGTAMMAPDYAWWHGFYECKNRFNHFMHEAELLLEGKADSKKAKNYPNATGPTKKPELLKYKK